MELFAGTLIAIIISTYFFLKGNKQPIACYSIRSINIIDVNHSDSNLEAKININYDKKPISRLSATTITFWNGGKLLLKREALLKNYPLRISMKSVGKILDAKIITDPNPQCECKLLSESDAFPNSVLLDFEFLEPNNGIVVQVLHTGQRGEIEVGGKLKGVRLENQYGSAADMYNSLSESINSYAIKIMVSLLLLFMVLQQYHTWIGLPEAFFSFIFDYMNSNSLFYKFLIGSSLFLFVSQFIITFLKNVSTHKIPKELGGS